MMAINKGESETAINKSMSGHACFRKWKATFLIKYKGLNVNSCKVPATIHLQFYRKENVLNRT